MIELFLNNQDWYWFMAVITAIAMAVEENWSSQRIYKLVSCCILGLFWFTFLPINFINHIRKGLDESR